MSRNRVIATKEHRRFVEFADAVKRQHTIGICFGQAGIGKTLSARRYAHWDRSQQLLETWGPRDDTDFAVYAALAKAKTVFYTPAVLTTPRQLKEELGLITSRVDICIDQHLHVSEPPERKPHYGGWKKHVTLNIVDESERLNATGLEVLRDRYDRDNIALILIGMPGIEKQFSRFPQLYSRVGFAHDYRPLSLEELTFVLQRQWRKLGLDLDVDDFTDSQAVAAIARITRGNFRLIDRLFTQVERIMKINDLQTLTDDVVEAARSTLVIGTS